MPLGLPSSPTLGQQWPVVSPIWEYDGAKWVAIAGTSGTATPVTDRLTSLVGTDDFIGLRGGVPYLVSADVIHTGPGAATAPAAFTAGQWTSTPGDTEIVVNITALPSDGGSAITALQYTLNGSTWTSFAGAGTGSRTIAGLTNSTSYPVQIRAVNAIGNGAASDTKNTTPTVITTAPAAFTVGQWTLAAGDTLLTVNITAVPSNGGSAITALEYRLDGGAAVAFAGTGTGSRNITGLTNATEYDVEIRAVNAIGPGAWSDLKSATPAIGGALTVSSTTGSPEVITGVTYGGVSGASYRFNTSGTIVFSGTGAVGFLEVAGGGPGGSGTGVVGGGGGGGGGVLGGVSTDVFTAVAGTYTIAVGAGGVAASAAGSNGSNSSIAGTNAPAAAVGGGRGASDAAAAATAGGSGGGGSQASNAGGAATSGHGFVGGTASGSNGGGGGGGGAGAQGVDIPGYQDDHGSNGGAGKLSSITGVATYYGGGGAGSDPAWQASTAAGGIGGGANPAAGTGNRAGLPGTANTGGGGSGAGGTALGGDGGSGVVILFVPS